MTGNKKTKHIEDPELFINARYPQGELGDKLLDWMTINHENLAKWGVGHLDIEKDDTILDVGCGGGVNVERFLEMTAGKVYGIDYSELAVKRSLQLNQKAIDDGRCEIIQGSVSEMPFEDNSFDVVTAFESVYFWPDFISDLKEVRRVLRDGGMLFICNEAVPKQNDERQQELIELLDMNIYSEDDFKLFLHRAGFSDVHCFSNNGPDSVTGEYVSWICVIAIK
jgi:ubiquinone/menaquinone biosynthesis C-methylase UbiE